MNYIKENTVCAKGQMKNSSNKFYYGNENSKNRILIVGNSITRHGYLPSIGWYNDFGMAASCEEKDYVHLIISSLDSNFKDYYLFVRQCAEWEVMVNEDNVDFEKLIDCRDFEPTIIIFRLGENIKTDIDYHYFKDSLSNFIKFININNCPIIYTTSFWKNDVVDKAIIHNRLKGDYLVRLDELGEKDENKAIGLFAHSGICAHPGDLGMQRIAEKILKVLLLLL